MIEFFNFYVVVTIITTDGKFLASYIQKHNSSANLLHLYNAEQVSDIGSDFVRISSVTLYKTRKQALEACRLNNQAFKDQGRYIYDSNRREA